MVRSATAAQAGSRLRPQPCLGPFGSVSRCAIYRLKSPVRRVQKPHIHCRWTGLGCKSYEPWHLWYLATAYAELGQRDDARRCIHNAIDKVERSKEKWCTRFTNRRATEE
jgi:hypothetical protein